MSIGGARHFIQRTKECAASWLSIMNSHVATAASRTPDAIFDIGSVRRVSSKLVLQHRRCPTRTLLQHGNGPIRMPTGHCTPALQKNLLIMELPLVLTWKISLLLGVRGGSIQTRCGVLLILKLWRGNDSEEIAWKATEHNPTAFRVGGKHAICPDCLASADS